jgi:hypothetical protein
MNLDDKSLVMTMVAGCVALFLAFALVGVGSKVIVKKTSEAVIQELRKSYTPGPFEPGFDPDKVDPSFFRNRSSGGPSEPSGSGGPPYPDFPSPRDDTWPVYDPSKDPRSNLFARPDNPWQGSWTELRN